MTVFVIKPLFSVRLGRFSPLTAKTAEGNFESRAITPNARADTSYHHQRARSSVSFNLDTEILSLPACWAPHAPYEQRGIFLSPCYSLFFSLNIISFFF